MRRRSCAGSRRSSGSTSRGRPAPGRRADHRAGRARRRRRRQPNGRSEREPIRGIKRQMFEHLTRAHREIPAVTWVEECDFAERRPEAARAARAQGGRGVAAGVPGAERARRGRRSRAARPLRHRHRGADRAGARRPGRPRLRLARRSTSSTPRSGVSPRRRRPASSTPEELRGGTFTVTSAGKRAGLFVTPLINHPEVAILGVHRIEERAGRARRRGRRPPDGERLGHVRPPRDRRQARRRLRPRGDRAAIAGAGDGRRSRRCGSSIDSILGAVARPSSRATTRLPSTSASAAPSPRGTARRDRAGRRRRPCFTASVPRSLRAMWASRLSIRRAGPERREVKKTSSGRLRSGCLLCGYPDEQRRKASRGTVHAMGAWYWIGVCAGLGAAAGVLLRGCCRCGARSIDRRHRAGAAPSAPASASASTSWQPAAGATSSQESPAASPARSARRRS